MRTHLIAVLVGITLAFWAMPGMSPVRADENCPDAGNSHTKNVGGEPSHGQSPAEPSGMTEPRTEPTDLHDLKTGAELQELENPHASEKETIGKSSSSESPLKNFFSNVFSGGHQNSSSKRPTASSTNPETGETTTVRDEGNGVRSVTTKDTSGNTVSNAQYAETGSGQGIVSTTDKATGTTTTVSSGPDEGQRTITKRDSSGNVMSQKTSGPDSKHPTASSTNPETGETTTVRDEGGGLRSITTKDAAGNTVSNTQVMDSSRQK